MRNWSPAYYNDNDPFVVAWLRRLIDRDLIPLGDVDDRSVLDVQPDDLRGYHQCHFFAGVGGWPFALRLAGVPDDEAIWTGSPPCQPLSGIGLRQGHADQRHVWPAFFRIIAERAPAMVFGEQVGGPDGREWLSGVRVDLERLGYAIGAASLPAASAGAPHKRDRLYFVAHAEPGAVGHTGEPRLERQRRHGDDAARRPVTYRPTATPSPPSFWSGFDLIEFNDGTTRRIEPGLEPLAHGVPARLGRLRGYGNAVVPQVAAQFVIAALAVRP